MMSIESETLHNTITSIDHPVIAVASLADSRGVYERLGFTVPPRGSHVEWGTGNWCIMFRDDYIELRGIIDPARFTLDLDKHLAEHGEGLMGVAFGTTGADEAFVRMKAAGMNPRPVKPLARNFELPEGWVQPKFRLCFPDNADVEGLLHVVVCEHLTPELMRRPEFLAHANGAVAVAGIVGVIGDAAKVEAVQRRLLGEAAVRRDGGRVTLTVPSGQTVELLPLQEFQDRYGAHWPDTARTRSVLPVLRVRVASVDATQRYFDAAGVPCARDGDALLVAPEHGCGVLFQFEAERPRTH
jgi:hypothetical protein